MVSSNKNLHPRLFQYVAMGLFLSVGSLLASFSSWEGGPYFHTVMETVATLLAFMVGALALIRYYTQTEAKFLYIGAGFIGTAVLDGYHALVTAPQIQPWMPSEYANLVPWSWIASRLFLSMLMVASWWLWFRARHNPAGQPTPHTVYRVTGLATLISLICFTFVPLPPLSLPASLIHRPVEFMPGVLFAMAMAGYLYKAEWKRDAFEHWLVISLIVGVATQIGFMPFSGQVNDAEFNIAHLLKKASYILVLTGLLVSLYHAYISLKEETARRVRLEEELRAEAAKLEQSRTWFKSIADYTYDWETWFSPAGELLYISPSCKRISGYPASAFISGEISMRKLISPKEPQGILRHFTRISDEQPREEIDFRIVTKEGEERWISHACQPIYSASGKFVGRRASNRDITDRKHAELTSQAMLQALHGSPVTIVITDSLGTIEYVNPKFTETSGYEEADAVGKNPRVLKSGHHSDEFYAHMWHMLTQGKAWTGDLLNKRRDGTPYWENASIFPVLDESGAIAKYVAIKREITAQKIQEESLYRQANYDALTGLPNRTLFGDRLQQALKRLSRHATPPRSP